MIADLKPYPAMKNSGVEWLREVPSHWTLLPGRACYRKKKVPNKGLMETTVLSLSYGHIVVKPPEKLHGLVPASFETYQIVEPGDIIVRPTDLQNDWNSLRFGLSRDRGVITSAYMCLCTEEVVTRPYGHLLLHTYDLKKVFYGLGSGLRQNLDWFDFKYLPCIVPPLSEQAAIVCFLDHADRRIRRYIHAKQKLVKLLEEQKQALIHQAVTGQIDVRTGRPYPAYKPSGVEWLGDVPEHWEVIRLGRLITLTTGFPFKSEGFTQSEEDVRLLRGVNIAPGRLRWEEVVRWSAADTDNFAEYQLELGDIVLGMDRPIIQDGIRVAVVEQSDVPSLLLQRVARIRPGEELKLDFTLLLLRGKSFSDYLAPIFTGISVPHLSPEQIGGFRFALHSLAEQEKILEQLRPSIGAIRSAMDRALSQILLLREYRTRLIADVVTGKLDVREAAASLLEEADERDPLDEGVPLESAEELAMESEVTV